MTMRGCRPVFRRDTHGEIVGGCSHCGGDGGCEYHRKGVY